MMDFINFIQSFPLWGRFVLWLFIGWVMVLGFWPLKWTPKQKAAEPAPVVSSSASSSASPVVVAPVVAPTVIFPPPAPPPPPQPQRVDVGSGTYIVGDVNIANLTINGAPAERQQVKVEGKGDTKATLNFYMLFDRAAWAYGKVDEYVNASNVNTNINDFLDDPVFAAEARKYDAILCLGLESGLGEPRPAATHTLAQQRGESLCYALAGKPYIDHDKTKIYGVGLGKHKTTGATKQSREERRQRGVIIVGVEGAKGEYLNEAQRNAMIQAVIRKDVLRASAGTADFRFGSYSGVSTGTGLQYVRVEWGVMKK